MYSAKHLSIKGIKTKNDKYLFNKLYNVVKENEESVPVQYVYREDSFFDGSKSEIFQTIGNQTYIHKQAIIYSLIKNDQSEYNTPEQKNMLARIVQSPFVYANDNIDENGVNKDTGEAFFMGNKLPHTEAFKNNRVVGIPVNGIKDWIAKYHSKKVLTPEQVQSINVLLRKLSDENNEKTYNHWLMGNSYEEYLNFLNSWSQYNNYLMSNIK